MAGDEREDIRGAREAVLGLGGGFPRAHDEDEQFRGVLAHVREAIAVPVGKKPLSIAVVDRTSLWRLTQLLAGERGSGDPFIALADLATVLGAAIFDDRIVVFGNEEVVGIAATANKLLGLDDVIRAVSFDPSPARGRQDDSALSYLTEHLTLSAYQELSRAAREGADWIGWLWANWKVLLPGLGDAPAYDRVSHVIDKYMGQPYDVYDLFNIVGGEWKFSFADPVELVLDNDLRALFYERVVQCLHVMLTRAGTGPAVHYAGGCLRIPLLLARARRLETAAHTSTRPSGYLQEAWTAFESARTAAFGGANPIVLPFWADAVLSRCERREDFKRVVPRYRSKASGFRKRRNEIDQAIWEGDRNELKKLLLALRGDGSQLVSDIGAATGQLTEKILPFATGVPVPGVALLTGAAARQLPQYLFRPHLQFLQRLGKDAGSLTRPLARSLKIFEYPAAHAADPSAFLERLGHIAWLT